MYEIQLLCMRSIFDVLDRTFMFDIEHLGMSSTYMYERDLMYEIELPCMRSSFHVLDRTFMYDIEHLCMSSTSMYEIELRCMR